jgi:hypothetical protein
MSDEAVSLGEASESPATRTAVRGRWWLPCNARRRFQQPDMHLPSPANVIGFPDNGT